MGIRSSGHLRYNKGQLEEIFEGSMSKSYAAELITLKLLRLAGSTEPALIY
jgi:hypothetical protein